MIRRASLIGLFLGGMGLGCGELPSTTTVALALGDIPDRVRTLTFTALDADLRVVASSTIAPPDRRFELGLPAEQPLELRVVARTSTPAFDGFLPAFAARQRRTIPLTESLVRLEIVLRPAGFLEVDARPAENLRLRSVSGGELPEVRLGGPRTIHVLQEGLHEIVSSDGDAVVGGADVWVAAERITRVIVREAPPTPIELLAQFLGPGGPLTSTSTFAPTGLRLEGRRDGEPVIDPDVELRLSYSSRPSLGFGGANRAFGLPVEVMLQGGLGEGERVVYARIDDGPRVRAGLDVGSLGTAAPARLRIEIVEASRLHSGSPVLVDVLDDAGRRTLRSDGVIDLDGSDPWVVAERRGPAAVEAGRARFLVRRSAAPVEGEVRLVARYRGVDGFVLTSTVVLPPL